MTQKDDLKYSRRRLMRDMAVGSLAGLTGCLGGSGSDTETMSGSDGGSTANRTNYKDPREIDYSVEEEGEQLPGDFEQSAAFVES